jgi:hypothetical protein
VAVLWARLSAQCWASVKSMAQKMNKAPQKNKDGGGPSVFRFEARLVRQSLAEKTGSSTLINVPKVVGKRLRGMSKLEGTINGHPFRAALEPNASGGRLLRVNKAMLNGAGADAGDTVKLAILGPEPAPTIPADLRGPLTASSKAKTLWQNLTPEGRRDWIRWIESAKTHETRARRIIRTVEQLSSGKRRPCCVNVYEFMLSRVQE